MLKYVQLCETQIVSRGFLIVLTNICSFCEFYSFFLATGLLLATRYGLNRELVGLDQDSQRVKFIKPHYGWVKLL